MIGEKLSEIFTEIEATLYEFHGTKPKYLRDRVLESHMSLQTCKDTLAANDLSKVNNIVLIHLSDGNSDEKRFKSEVEQATGKNVTVAGNGMKIGFNKQPF